MAVREREAQWPGHNSVTVARQNCQMDQGQVDQGTTGGRPGELEEQASTLSLPPPSSSSSSSSSLPPTRRTNRTRKQRNKFN